MSSQDYKIVQVPVRDVKFFVRRARGETAYSRLKDSILKVGLKTPVGVRDITDRPESKRKKPGGGFYSYELVYGQGRLQAFRELNFTHVPAVIVDVSEEEIVGRFLAENMMRRRMGWKEKARLVQHDIEEHGFSLEEVASRYCITVSHAKKYLRVIQGASLKALSKAEDGEFTLGITEKLTTIPREDQDLVIDVMDENDLDKTAVRHLVDVASRLRKSDGMVLRDSLSASIADVDSELKKLRSLFKLKRAEYGLGPQNLYKLCDDSEFIALAESKGVEVGHFLN